MPLVPSTDPSVLRDRMRRLRLQAAHHKSEARRHRKALHDTMTTLAALEAECRTRNIPTGEGVIHGHQQ